MKKVLNVSLTLLAAAMLTACGGSGSKSESLTPAPEPTNPGVTEEVVEQPTDPVVDEQPAENGSNISTLSDRTYLGTTDDLSKIIVDGQEIVLRPPTLFSGSFIVLPAASGSFTSTGGDMSANSCCGNLSYTRFGQLRSADGELFSFVHGLEFTPEMDVPVTGVVNYSGGAINNWAQGSATLVADFGNRTVKGTLAGTEPSGILLEPSVQQASFGAPIYVDADISGSFFHGTAQSGSANAALEGAFFGPAAAEMGAVFEGDGLSGSFGAKKD